MCAGFICEVALSDELYNTYTPNKKLNRSYIFLCGQYIPENLRAGPIWLRFDKIVLGDDSQGLVPFYRFDLIIDEVQVAENDPAYRGGARRKLRYLWEIPDVCNLVDE